MKSGFLKVIFATLSLFLLVIFTQMPVFAYGGTEYVISQDNRGYTLFEIDESGISEIGVYEKLQSAIGVIESGRVYLKNLTTDEKLTLESDIQISGEINFTNGGIIISGGADVTLCDMNLDATDSAIRIKDGGLTLKDAKIQGNGKIFILDYSSSSSLTLISGEISGAENATIIDNSAGLVKILGGRIDGKIENSATLILSGAPEITKGVYTSAPITLSNSGDSFSGKLTVYYDEIFERGEMRCVFYLANEFSLSGITLYDRLLEKYEVKYFDSYEGIDEKSFGAAYLPYNVSFYVFGELYRVEYLLKNEKIPQIKAPGKSGYKFNYWSCGEGSFDFAVSPQGDIRLDAVYSLNAPNFTLSSMNFIYDGEGRSLSLSALSHELLEFGTVSYSWYKDGAFISSDESVNIKDVSDSGKYYLIFIFSYNGDIASVKTPEITVKVEKATVTLTELESVSYSGRHENVREADTDLYKIECVGGVHAGVYEARIILKSPENYRFSNSDEPEITLDFEILKAENSWLSELRIENIYESGSANPIARAQFGEVEFFYAREGDEEFIKGLPSESGKYKIKAAVSGCDDYTGLESKILDFEIYSERVKSIRVCYPPSVTSYKAFEKFNSDGASFTVVYDSGRWEEISGESVSYSYLNGESFRFGDSFVICEYMGARTEIEVSVRKADYDLSGLSFKDAKKVYTGEKQWIFYEGALPIGLDGETLNCKCLGGGINVGTYTVLLEFYSDSDNYNVPKSMSATLEILPFEVECVITESIFTYDGTPKAPSAYYTDVFGRRCTLGIIGEKSLAGEYSAVAVLEDSNYKIINPLIDFTIEKANYDMSKVVFSDSDFVYDGEEKGIYIVSGLPLGVEVIGYSDNVGLDAGKYLAKFAFSYDTHNYNPPALSSYEWEIEKAEYEFDSGIFEDVKCHFDGQMHYPVINSDMPVGKDGSLLGYEFSAGAMHVSEGVVSVVITFHTDSKNYIAPAPIIKTVEILPKNITVEWLNNSFVYNGLEQKPTATSELCELVILGGGVDAGKYTASAISKNSDYFVVNGTFEYEIAQAQNRFTAYPQISDIFSGYELSPTARVYSGEVYYRYFFDKELTREVSGELEAGKYYLVAYSNGTKNYAPIESEPVEFNVIKIKPASLTAEVKNTSFKAYEQPDENDFSFYLVNNDGSRKNLSFSDIKFCFSSGSAILYGDEYIEAEYQGFKIKIKISTEKADYDMSDVVWENTVVTYNGKEQSVILSGLPDGVTVLEYTGGFGINAGVYTAGALLSYDEANYNPPTLPYGALTVEKAIVALPAPSLLFYNGEEQMPPLTDTDFYTVGIVKGRIAGKYPIVFKIRDIENYTFEDGLEVRSYYEILPLKIKIKILDAHTYIFEREPSFDYEITEGALIHGDELSLRYIVEDGVISAISNNPCYEVEAIGGILTEHNGFSKRGLEIFLFAVFGFLALCILAVALYISRYRIKRALFRVSYRFKKQPSIPQPTQIVREENVKVSEGVTEDALGIDVKKADELISDTLAKSLVKKEDTVVYTSGNKKGIINVDTLSENFASGDTIDINDLKTRSLVPYDTGYIKVLARGIIDKPLRVYANDFSLSAVKMIALTGGEALRCVTKGEKEKKNGETS